MANKHRFRHGQMELVDVPVESATVIEIGDMVYLEATGGEVKPASSFAAGGSFSALQQGFANVFLGIAYQASASGETDNISVDVSPTSVYEFAVASATYTLGEDLGPDNSASAGALDDQQLEAVSATANAVARAAEYAASAVTSLHVKFASAFNPAANNVNAVVG